MAQTLPQIADVRDLSEQFRSRRDGLLCALLMTACVLLAQPFVEMGFVDDWSYVKTAQVFIQTGHFAYNGWATAALGWQILWGALFGKLLGFSFVHVRLATLPIGAASVYLFHRILIRFGISRGNAIFGTLTLALSPVFIVLSASYLSDVYGLFCTLVCLYLCQRAVSATTDRAAFAWLCFAAVTNVAGGTVRQTAWLGVLVMVPATTWLLRSRRNVFWGGALLWVAGVVSVWACMQWINHQPYFVPMSIVPEGLSAAALKYLVTREIFTGVKVLLCLALMVFPILVVWWPLAGFIPRRLLLWLSLVSVVLLTGFLVYSDRHDHLSPRLAPWITHLIGAMATSGGDIPGPAPGPFQNWQRVIVTALVLGSAFIFFLHMFSQLWKRAYASRPNPIGWSHLFWLLGPWAVSYIAALADLSIKGSPMYDRYLPTLQVIVTIFLLRYYQDFAAPDNTRRLPAVSKLALAAVAAFAVAGTHDWYAISRARLEAAEEVRRSGVPRTAIQAGFEYDSWTQLEAGGYINFPSIRIPKGAYRPVPYSPNFPPACAASWFSVAFTPALVPQYFLVHAALPCLAPTQFAPVTYHSWMPPFTRKIYVYRRRSAGE